MQGKNILFHDPDPKTCRVAKRALIATGSNVDIASDKVSLREQIQHQAYDLMMVNFGAPTQAIHKWGTLLSDLESNFPKTKIVLHASASTEDYFPVMMTRSYLRNLIAKNNDPLNPDELIITTEKLLRRDIFGLQKYLMWGVEPYCVTVRDSQKKHNYVQDVAEYASALGCSDRTVELVETIVDEVVTNAIYNAPRTADGQPKYAKLSRREHVVLEDHEVAQLQFACDGEYIAIAQIDPFGSLTQKTIVTYFNRCLSKGPHQFSDNTGGAGIGLFRVFQSLSKFVVNIEPGSKTEIIALIDLRLSRRRFRQSPKSFHIFINDDTHELGPQ